MRIPATFAVFLGLMTGLLAADGKSSLSPAAAKGWNDNAQFLANEAAQTFTRLIKRDEGGTRENQLGLALSFLSLQPVTVEHLEDARKTLTQLAAVDDEPGLAAQYFLARIVQNYQEKPDYAGAAARYRQLIERHRDHYWGQLSIGKLAILMLYVLPEEKPEARIAGVEALLPLCQPVAARELHMVLGDAMLYYGLSKNAALAHLVAAETIKDRSELPDSVRAELIVQIIDISARTGHLPQAQAYLKRFAKEYPRDWRNYALRQVVTAVEAGREPPIP